MSKETIPWTEPNSKFILFYVGLLENGSHLRTRHCQRAYHQCLVKIFRTVQWNSVLNSQSYHGYLHYPI